MSNPIFKWSRSVAALVLSLILPLSFLVSGIALQSLASFTPWLVERIYTRPIYPRVVSSLSFLSRRVGFSVGEVALYVILLVGCAGAVLFCAGLARRRDRWRSWVSELIRYGVWAAAGFLWLFLLTFGLNYQRPLLFELLGYEYRKAEPQEFAGLGQMMVESVNQSYAEAHAGDRAAPNTREIVGLLNESYNSQQEFALLPRGELAPPKPVYASGVLTRLGISGIYFPFTAEPNYNADVPDFQLPFTIAHEMAHQRGVARESEANFVAYVVCINSRDPFVRYSGYRNGLGVLSELYRVNPEKARELARQLGPGYREDSRRAAQFWAKASGAAGVLSNRVNDLYLRANRVRSGVADYSDSTTLIIAYHLWQRASGALESQH